MSNLNKNKEDINSGINDNTGIPNHNQEFIDQICNEVIKDVYSQFNGFKLVCTGHLFGKGNAAFFFNSYSLWDKKTDYYVTSLYTDKDETFYAYICLFIIAP